MRKEKVTIGLTGRWCGVPRKLTGVAVSCRFVSLWRRSRLAPERADVAPRGMLGAVRAGPAGTRVNEHPGAGSDPADSQPADAELRHSQRDSEDGHGRI